MKEPEPITTNVSHGHYTQPYPKMSNSFVQHMFLNF